MTIKELEKRSGLPRTAIRFYEQQGLITPERREIRAALAVRNKWRGNPALRTLRQPPVRPLRHPPGLRAFAHDRAQSPARRRRRRPAEPVLRIRNEKRGIQVRPKAADRGSFGGRHRFLQPAARSGQSHA